MEYYSLDVDKVLWELGSSSNGLSEKEINERLIKFGRNELEEKRKFSSWALFFSQFKDLIIVILILAVFISLAIGAFLDAIVIGIILILNALFGFFQEFKAERAIALLKKVSSPKAMVIRDGYRKIIDATGIVPGDILLLEYGDKVVADARLLSVADLEVDESLLTGESVPVQKKVVAIKKKVELAEQKNMVFSGTIIVKGKGRAVVTSTGMLTELGKIAELVQEVEEAETPLQIKLRELGKWLALIILIVCFVVFVTGVVIGKESIEMFLIALSLAVGAIPEGLPAVVTICLALGMQRMLKRNALVRKLRSIETLGCATVICADKTGTLTCNEMTVKEIYYDDKFVNVSGDGYDLKGDFYFKGKKIEPNKLLLEIAASCNDADLVPLIGDPTELALLVAAAKNDVHKLGRIDEIPFSSARKYMVTIHKEKGKIFSYIKGAPETILGLCGRINIDGKVRKLTKSDKEKISKKNEEMAKHALRVLAFAYKEDKNIEDLVFVGLMGMIDPPRKKVKDAIDICKRAGIKVVMITGDHKSTAETIGKQIGITGKILEGKDLDLINDKELEKIVKDIAVYARVNPEHKVRILEAWQKNDEIVAMTGDGVNDAPALEKANIGVAMSLKGTDVCREAADIVLTDDNFISIVNAIKEGRIIYDNIKKFIKFLLSTNLDEIVLILFSILIGLPLPLLPLQILWINFVTDGLPALALSVEPSDRVMHRKPRKVKESIFKDIIWFIVVAGILAFIVNFFVFYSELENLDKARTMVLSTIVMFDLFFVFSCRSERNIFDIGVFSNRYLVWAVLITFGLHLAIIYTPLNVAFKLVPLGLLDWVKIVLLGSVGFVLFEIRKILKKKKV